MIRTLAMAALFVTVAATPSAAGLSIDRRDDRLVIATDAGEPVAEYVFADPAIGRPSLRDLRTPEGLVVTRPCPPRPGIDPQDHPTMHPGLMLCFSDLSGHDPWRHKTAVRFLGFDGEPATGDWGDASFTARLAYLGAAADTPDAPVVSGRITLPRMAAPGQRRRRPACRHRPRRPPCHAPRAVDRGRHRA